MKKFTSTELIHKKWDEWERTWLTATVWMLCNSCVLSRPDRWGSMTFRMRPLKGEICPQPCNSRKWIKCNVHSSQLALLAQHVHLLKGPRQSYRHTILASCRYSSKAHKLSRANVSAAGIMERNKFSRTVRRNPVCQVLLLLPTAGVNRDDGHVRRLGPDQLLRHVLWCKCQPFDEAFWRGHAHNLCSVLGDS